MCGDPHERRPAILDQILWEERQLVSVANRTRKDGIDDVALRMAPRPAGIGGLGESEGLAPGAANRAADTYAQTAAAFTARAVSRESCHSRRGPQAAKARGR